MNDSAFSMAIFCTVSIGPYITIAIQTSMLFHCCGFFVQQYRFSLPQLLPSLVFAVKGCDAVKALEKIVDARRDPWRESNVHLQF